jgi:outer membrane protein assembly complex protein YaeT
MYRKVFLILLMMVAGICAADAQEGFFRLSRLKVAGIETVPKKELAETLSAKLPSRFRFWIAKPILTEADLVDDIQRIKQFYQAYGYYHVQAGYLLHKIKDLPQKTSGKKPGDGSGVPQLFNPTPDYTAEVVFTITEGPRTLVKTIDIKINPSGEDIREAQLRPKLSLSIGRPFETQKFRESKLSLEKELGNSGYPFFKVTGNVVVDIRSNTAAVSFDIVPGEKSRFGDLLIVQKDSPVQETLIQRAITFKPGEAFEARKLEQSQRNLYNLDVFKSALIKTEPSPPESNTVPMRLELKPKKQQSIKFGVGYGSEDGFRVKTGWAYRNIAGWAGRFSMNAKRSDIYEGISGDYSQPYLWDSKNQLRAAGGIERETLDSYDNRKSYSNVSLTRKVLKEWDLILKYNLEINRLEDLNVTDPDELVAFEREHNYWISSLAWGVAQNTTDNEINPTKGHFFSFSIETASGLLGSNLSFIKPDLEVKHYQPLAFETVLAGRLRFESLQEIEKTDYIPIFKRLFLGGGNSVRGYGYQKLGLLDDTGNPLGGLSAMNANLELRRPIYASLAGVLFLDMGLLDEKAFHYDMRQIRYSSGVGFRYDTPVGPIRVDWGYKLNPRTEKEDTWRIHFSVGQAF